MSAERRNSFRTFIGEDNVVCMQSSPTTSAKTVRSRPTTDSCTPILLFPSTVEKRPQKKVSFVDAMEQLQELTIREEEESYDDTHTLTEVSRGAAGGACTPTVSYDSSNGVTGTRSVSRHTASGWERYVEGEYDGSISADCVANNEKRVSRSYSDDVTNRRRPSFHSVHTIDALRRQTLGGERPRVEYIDRGDFNDYRLVGTFPGRKSVSHSGEHTFLQKPQASGFLPDERRSFRSSLRYTDSQSFTSGELGNRLYEARIPRTDFLVGGDDYDCDYVDMSSMTSITQLEDINLKIDHLMDSIDKQRKRIDTMHRLFEDGKHKPVSDGSTYQSLADDLYRENLDAATDEKEGKADVPRKQGMKKMKKKFLFSCVQ